MFKDLAEQYGAVLVVLREFRIRVMALDNIAVC